MASFVVALSASSYYHQEKNKAFLSGSVEGDPSKTTFSPGRTLRTVAPFTLATG